MASIFDSLQFENSSIPDSVRRAAQGEMDYQKAIRNKLPLGVEGSGIPEGIRKAAQGAVERGVKLDAITNAPYAEPVADPWMQGQKAIPKGMFGDAAKAVGKVVGKSVGGLGALAAGVEGAEMLNDKYGYGAYQNIKNAMEEGRTRRAMEADPELANRGQETVNRITGNAMQGLADYLPQYQDQPQGLTQEELNAENPNEKMDTPLQSPMEAPPVTPTPVGPVAQAAPTTVPQAAAKTAQDMETQRQTLEAGAVKGLSTGAVSRPEFAQQIAQADAQKAGVTLTPEQLKAATATELTNMKSMDNNEVSRYISYALMAAGVLATVFDKSGKAGDAFSASFNKQLDRNLTGGLAAQKNAAAQAKLQQELLLKLRDQQIAQQKADTGDRSVTQTGEYQQGTLEQRAQQAADANKLGYYRVGAADARSARSNSIQQQRLEQDQRQFDATYGLQSKDRDLNQERFEYDKKYKANKNAIEAAKAAASGGEKGVDLPTKEAEGLVAEAAKSQGVTVSKPVKQAAAQTVRIAIKNHPKEFAQDPNGFVLRELNKANGPYQQKPGSFGGLLSPSIEQRKLK